MFASSSLCSLAVVTKFIVILVIACFQRSFVTGNHEIESTLKANKENKCNRNVDVYETINEPPLTDENRGKPLHCSYRIRIRPERNDWMVFLRFTRFKIGDVSPDRKECIGGYIAIIDGYKDSNVSKHTNPGYFCGEIDMPKTFISETPNVKIIIYVASYNEDTQFQFSTEIQKREEHYTKLGQYHKLHNRRGRLVDGTYCDRVFDDCTPGHCYIHSPGFPEIYNRNLKCRYTVKARKGLVALEVLTLDIDGEKCEGLLICFARPVTTKPEECPHDYVRIYDGANDSSPLISTLCGRGRLQSNVIASGSEMFIEFISSPAGSLIDTGFQLKIENIEDDDDAIPMESKNGSCVIKRTIVEPNTSYMFTNIKSWYPPNTTCSYIFSTPHPNDHISLEFLSFRIDRITLCKESIRLFDGLDADPFKLMNVLCDTNKPMGGASEARYVTSGPNLLVQFVSDDGSLDGSAINYRFEIKRIVAAKKVSATEVSKNCSKVITPESLSSGSLTLHPEDFNKSIDGQITCNLTFDATSLLHGRVNLSILSAFNPSLICGKYCDIGIIGNNQAKLTIYRNADFAHLLSPLCFCEPITSSFAFSFQSHPRVPQQITTISNSSSLTIAFILPPDWGQRKTSIPIQVIYRFVREYRCGAQETLAAELQGKLHFPFKTDSLLDTREISRKLNSTTSTLHLKNYAENDNFAENANLLRENPLFCKWSIQVFPEFDIAFNVEDLNLPFDCSNDDFLLLKDIPLCVQNAFSSNFASFYDYYYNHQYNFGHTQRHFADFKDHKSFIIKREELRNGQELHFENIDGAPSQVNIYLSASNPENSSFTLYWTQLKVLPESAESPESLVTLSKECEFLCKSSKTCLRRDLVCNGFPNCPNTANGANTANYEDEFDSICHQNSFLFTLISNKIVWIFAAVSLVSLTFAVLVYVFVRLKKFRKKNTHF